MPKKCSVKPLVQGSLDGLCGLYAIVNAAKYLFPKDNIDLERLFHFLIDTIDNQHNLNLSTVLKGGLGTKNLKILLNAVIREYIMHNERLLDFSIYKNNLDARRIDHAVEEMKNFLHEPNAPRRIIIAGLDGVINHWTCITAIKEKTIYFLDGESKVCNIDDFHITSENGRQCSEGYYIYYNNVLFLEAVRKPVS